MITWKNMDALAAYAKHPLHLEAKTHFSHLLETRVCADYDL